MQELEPIVHGRGRKASSLDETYLGVFEQLLYARKTEPVEGILLLYNLCNFRDSIARFCCIAYGNRFVGAQWTGIVTTIAIEMLKRGMVDAVICVQRFIFFFD